MVIAVTCWATNEAVALTRRVPEDYPTIQAALDAATADDLIEVAAGTYNERLNLTKGGVTLQGASRTSILQGINTAASIVCSGINSPTTIRGFHITGAQYGIRVMGGVSGLTIEDNLFTANVSQTSGVAIRLENGAAAHVARNEIQSCGRGIEGLGNNSVLIEDNSISDCRGAYGGGIHLTSAQSPRILRNEIYSCWDGAITLNRPIDAIVTNNRILANGAWDQSAGCNIYLDPDQVALICNNVFRYNTVSHNGQGVGLSANGSATSSVELHNNVFAHNYHSAIGPHGNAVYLCNITAVAKNNVFLENGTGPDVVFANGTGSKEFSYNDVWEPSTATPLVGVATGDGMLQQAPGFLDETHFVPGPGSPCINTGDPATPFLDRDGSRNDMGIYGGPYASSAVELSTAARNKLTQYAKGSIRYFTSPQSNNKLAGFTHAFWGQAVAGGWRDCSSPGNCTSPDWALTRGYGSHVNINEVTLRFVALAAAYKMDWLDYYPSTARYSESWGQIRIGLETLRAMQASGNPQRYHQGTFHRAYITTITRNGQPDVDRSAAEIALTGAFEQSSDDNGLPYMNLLVLEGLAADPQVTIPDRQAIVDLCRAVRAGIDLRRFKQGNTVVVNFVNDLPSALAWDRLGAEGPIILAAMLISGRITLDEFYLIAPTLQNRTVEWSSHLSGAIPISRATYHGAMFIHGLRSIHGMPVTETEAAGATYAQDSLTPVVAAHMDLATYGGLSALGSQPMTQPLNGYPLFEYWSGPGEGSGELRQVQYAGNEQNHMPDISRFTQDGAMARATAPHAWFVPLSRWQQLNQPQLDTMLAWMSAYEGEFFHGGSDTQLGWEAVIPWKPTDTTYAWTGGGKSNFSDWGRPYEALNAAYIVLHAFDALNPDKPLSAYNIEAQRVAALARYFDSAIAIPAELFTWSVRPDLDRDGDVDGQDLSIFESCASGPGLDYAHSGNCQDADLQNDGDIDVADFGVFQRCIGGADRAVDLNCLN